MNVRFTLLLALALIPAAAVRVSRAADEPVVVSSRPLHEGRISPMLFGNFIERLDDLVPGMRAELLNDCGFECVVPAAKWVHYDGAPTGLAQAGPAVQNESRTGPGSRQDDAAEAVRLHDRTAGAVGRRGRVRATLNEPGAGRRPRAITLNARAPRGSEPCPRGHGRARR